MILMFHLKKSILLPRYTFLILFILFFSSCNDNRNTAKPNFIFILVDDLGKEWISTYGAEDIETPQIDQLAEKGIKFTKAYSMPQCTPSRVALLTGQYPNINGWINHYDVPRWGHGARFDPERYPVFAKQMRDAGYRTCAAGKWQINDFRLEPEAMQNAGFEEYFMWTGGEGGNEEISDERYWDPYIHSKEGSKTYKDQFGPDLFSDFIIRFMEQNKDHPFLVYYPMVLTHTPFVHTPHEPDVVSKIDKHKAMVRYTDFIVGKIIDALERFDLRNKTYVIFTTDNGTTPAIAGLRNGSYIIGGKTYLSENGINAPMIINHPGIIKEGRVSDALIDFTDIFPTLSELGRVKNKQGSQNIQGKSFASLLRSQEKKRNKKWIMAMGSHPAMINEKDRVQSFFKFRDRAFRSDQFKVYVDTLSKMQRIFDLSSDPFETNNLVNTNTKIIDSIRNEIRSLLNKMPEQDHDPDYRKLDDSIWDISPSQLNKMSERANRRTNKVGPLISKEKYRELMH